MKGSVAPPSESERTAFAEATGIVACRVENQASNESIARHPSFEIQPPAMSTSVSAAKADAPPPAPFAPFPRAFWTANVTELFERGAYYTMASFVVIYFGRLGMGHYWPSTLNSVLWTLVYFLPILSGTVADQIGFKRALLGAFVLLVGGYLLMGAPVWFADTTLLDKAGDRL